MRVLLICALLAALLTGCLNIGCTAPDTMGSKPNVSTSSASTPDTTPTQSTTAPQPTEPQPTEPQPTEPQPTEPQPTEPQPTEPQPTEPQPTEPQPTEPQPTEPQPTEPQPTEPQPTEPQPTETTPPDPVPPLEEVLANLHAKNVFVYDTRTGAYLYLSAELDKQVFPASITKLFTTYVALQHLPADELVTAGDELDLLYKDASVAGLQKGGCYTAETLAYCALLPSGCDASYTLATAAGRKILSNPDASVADAVSAFMAACNQTAADLGMLNTHFVTPDGNHDSNHYLSLQAATIIGELCLNHADISRIVGTYKIILPYSDPQGEEATLTLYNSNQTINPYSEYYNSLSAGGKTGYTAPAGTCLLNAYRVDDGYLLIGVFGCTFVDDRFEDANALFAYFEKLYG